MLRVDIKPMSVNEAWQGKRFKTPAYKRYERDLLLILPPRVEVPLGQLKVTYEFGVSSKLSDYDNPIKPFQDVLQKKYKFDDRRIVRADVIKTMVPKGQEFIKFRIEATV